MAARISGPATGCSSTESSRRLEARPWPSASVTALAMPRASRPSARVSAGTNATGSRGGSASNGSRAAITSASPRLRTATVSITGTPSRVASAALSSFSPSRAAMSIRLSAITAGMPSRSTSSAKRRCAARLVASATISIASGRRSPACNPSSVSRVTASSSDRGTNP